MGYFCKLKGNITLFSFCSSPQVSIEKKWPCRAEGGRGNCEPSAKHRFLRHHKKKLEARVDIWHDSCVNFSENDANGFDVLQKNRLMILVQNPIDV